MNLSFFDRLANTLEENEGLQNFMKEIGNFLKETIQGNNMDILERIEKQEKVSLVSKNKMRNQKQEILKSYAQGEQEELYFVTKKRNEDNVYRVEKYNGNNMEVLDLQLSSDTPINSVMRKNGEEYIIDKEITNDAIQDIENMAKEVLQEQRQELEDYRKEGHVYLVTEDTNGRIYLSNQTENRGYEVEEVEIPESIRNEIAEGTRLKYENGMYHAV